MRIEHSGKTFDSLGRDKGGNHIWPIDEFLSRYKCQPKVAERIARLNPSGTTEGERPRGVHRKTNPRWFYDIISKGHFIRRNGRAAWESVPRAFIRKYGKRAYVPYTYVVDSGCVR